jgi:hypothetical protein
MERRHTIPRRTLALLAGALAGVAAAVPTMAAVAHVLAPDISEPLLEATHLPALITDPSEPVDLAYDVYCATDESEASAPCDANGTVYVRAGEAGAFEALALRRDPAAPGLRLTARVPAGIAASRAGFSYYAAISSEASGRSVTLPAGGSGAPQQSLPLARDAAVELGRQAFGPGREADARVAEASWGSGPGAVGLEQGRNLAPIGGSSFDVDESGVVTVLDEANRRLLRWRPGARSPEHVPLSIRGTLADLSVGTDGTLYVLETAADVGRAAQLRAFGADGVAHDVVDLAERGSAVRVGPDGPVVLRQPSGQWMPAILDGRPLGASEQSRAGRTGRPVAGGREVVVLRTGAYEVRAALLGANGTQRTWRVTSDTALAEVQLAEPYREGLVLVVRAYTDDAAEFVVLVLGHKGLVGRFSLDANDWAETAPVSRFRLAGSSLYQLGSTPDGIFVDRFDLEVQ